MIFKQNIRIGIWGYGKTGKSAINYFHTLGYRLGIMDQRALNIKEMSYLENKGVTFYNENQQEQFFSHHEYIIPSSGINIKKECYERYKNKWLHELDFFNEIFNRPIIAITGSVGKTSTVYILSEIFKKLSIPVVVGGNIGIPTFDLIDQEKYVDYALLEVSSFQLMHCLRFAPKLSILTNFHPNHLDYHETEQNYFLAKHVIFDHQKNGSLSLLPLVLRDRISPPFAHHIRGYYEAICPDTIFLATLQYNECLYYIKNNNVIRYSNGIHTYLMTLTENILKTSFLDNILLIVAACDMLKINSQVLYDIASTVKLPEHRIEKVDSIDMINFYNDSKATTIISARAAIEKLSHQPLHLFIGGLSKGVDRAPFIAGLKNQTKHIYCFGKEAETLHAMCVNNNISSSFHVNLEDAFDRCINNIQPQDCVLLSPAGSSYDLYKDYEERGRHFKKLVKNYVNARQGRLSK